MAENTMNIPQFYKVTAQDILDYKSLDTVGKAIILNKIDAIKEDAIFVFPTSDGTNGESIGRASELLKVLGAVDSEGGEVLWDPLLGAVPDLNLTRNSVKSDSAILGAKKTSTEALDIDLDS
jgi:outer membrane protein assembly factor BamB